MQQYFVKGQVENPVIIRDKDTLKHMFSVMRLVEDDEVVLVFEDGIKRLARVADRERHVLNLVEEFPDNAELPLHVTVASGFPKGTSWNGWLRKRQNWEQLLSGLFQQTGL